MGKSYQGIFGSWQKKVGNVVGRIRAGQQILAIYQPNVANPRTEAQMSQRTRFSLILQVLRASKSYVRLGWQGAKHGLVSAFNAAMSHNVKVAITGDYPMQTVNYSALSVGNGSIDNVWNPSFNYDDYTVQFTWLDNSGIGEAKDTDYVLALLFNKDKMMSVQKNVGYRDERTGSIDVPDNWEGDTIWIYLSSIRGTEDSSKSVCLGSQLIPVS